MLELPINRLGKYTKFHIQKMEFAFSNKMTSCKLIKTQFNISFMQDYNFLVLITDQISKNVYIMFIKLRGPSAPLSVSSTVNGNPNTTVLKCIWVYTKLINYLLYSNLLFHYIFQMHIVKSLQYLFINISYATYCAQVD